MQMQPWVYRWKCSSTSYFTACSCSYSVRFFFFKKGEA